MHIGLIGRIGPAATGFYYRRLISTFASKKAALELTIVVAAVRGRAPFREWWPFASSGVVFGYLVVLLFVFYT